MKSETNESVVVLPLSTVEAVEAYLRKVVKHLAGTAGVDAQGLSRPGQEVLMDLIAEHSKSDEAVRLWGSARSASSLPPARLRAVPGGGGGNG